MPRKALATARAALRFAHRAADERGSARHHAEAAIRAQEMAFHSRVSPSSHVPTLTKNFRAEVDNATSLGVFYNLCRSPSRAGHHKPPVRADRVVAFHRLEQVCAVSTRRQPQPLRH